MNDPRQSVLKCSGLDLFNGTVRDSMQAGIIEPSLVKAKAIKSATEAAISILRIDDFIKSFPDKQEE